MLSYFITEISYSEIASALLETVYMLGLSVFFSMILGIPIGFILYLTTKGMILQNRIINLILSIIVNIIRSVPFIILLIIMMPLTTFFVGTSLGVKGVIPPLVVGAFPFFARLVETSLKDLDVGVIHMAESCGATNWQIVWRILLPEILPSIIASVTLTAIALVSYTAMAGVVGGGGLGDLAIRYGYQRFQTNVMLVTVILLVVMVQLIQVLGDYLAKKIKK